MDFTLYEEVSKVIKKAKEDPQFFHDLIFNTEKAISKLDVDRRIKGRLLSISPENALAALMTGFGGLGGGGAIFQAAPQCTLSCAGSCQVTCVGSCTRTIGVVAEDIINPSYRMGYY